MTMAVHPEGKVVIHTDGQESLEVFKEMGVQRQLVLVADVMKDADYFAYLAVWTVALRFENKLAVETLLASWWNEEWSGGLDQWAVRMPVNVSDD